MLSLFSMLIDEDSDKIFFNSIYEEYEKSVWFIANRILENPQLSEDAAQETFKRISANIRTLRRLDELERRKYIYIAARNAALDIAKKENRQQRIIEKSKYAKIIHEKSDSIYRSETKELILYVMDKLPQKYKDVMYLRYISELSEKEIAQSLGIKTNLVYQQISRGKKMFIKLYKKEANK